MRARFCVCCKLERILFLFSSILFLFFFIFWRWYNDKKSAYFGRRKFGHITFVSVYRRYVSGFQNVPAVLATYRRDWWCRFWSAYSLNLKFEPSN